MSSDRLRPNACTAMRTADEAQDGEVADLEALDGPWPIEDDGSHGYDGSFVPAVSMAVSQSRSARLVARAETRIPRR